MNHVLVWVDAARGLVLTMLAFGFCGAAGDFAQGVLLVSRQLQAKFVARE